MLPELHCNREMDRELILRKFESLRMWQSGGVRAPHKPLLVLCAIGKLLRGEGRLIPYSEVDEILGNLLKQFGHERSKTGTHFPFWRLQNDGIWEIPDADRVRQTVGGDAVKGDLVRYNVSGGFTEEIARQLQNDPSLASEIVQKI